jgi:hypothetical protein
MHLDLRDEKSSRDAVVVRERATPKSFWDGLNVFGNTYGRVSTV